MHGALDDLTEEGLQRTTRREGSVAPQALAEASIRGENGDDNEGGEAAVLIEAGRELVGTCAATCDARSSAG